MLERLNDADIMREYVLGDIKRYNHRRKLKEESVAEHVFFVSIFCLRVMASLDLSAEEQRQVMVGATLHDVAESATSDIPHDVKEKYEGIKSCIDEVEKDYINKHWSKYKSEVEEQTEIVHNIIKLADAYSVLQYCINENELGNNSNEMCIIKADANARVEKFTNNINEIMNSRKMEVV